MEATHSNYLDAQVGHPRNRQVMAVVTENPAEGAFQLYTIANEEAVSPIPDSLSLEKAAVLPLAVSTATVALYTPKQLALPLPSLSPKPTNRVLLVWGGSSSVGGMGIQFGKQSGFRIAATCSPRNNEYVKSLGAEFVFDYSSTSVVEDIVEGLKDYEVVGIFNAIGGENSGIACNGIISQVTTPTSRRHVATVPPLPSSIPDGVTVEALGSAARCSSTTERESLPTCGKTSYLKHLRKGWSEPSPSHSSLVQVWRK